jgi:hypothetical protein
MAMEVRTKDVRAHVIACELLQVGLSSRKLNALRIVCDCHRRTGALSASWSLEQKKLLSCAHFVIIIFCLHK